MNKIKSASSKNSVNSSDQSDFYDCVSDIYEEIFPASPQFLEICTKVIYNDQIENSRILDIGCGPGLQMAMLNAAGFQCDGLDPSEKMVQQAKTHPELNPEQAWIGSFENLCIPQNKEYSLCYSIGNTFSYLAPKDESPFFKQLKAHIIPGGLFLIQTVNWDKITYPFNFPQKSLISGKTFHRSYRQLSQGIVEFKTELCQNAEVLRWFHTLYPRSCSNLRKLFTSHGFAIEAFYGSFQGEEWTRSSPANHTSWQP